MPEIQQMTGFQSPCAEYAEDRPSLDERFFTNPPAMYPVRVGADNKFFDVKKGDHLIIDRSRDPSHGDLVLAVICNEFKLARFSRGAAGPVLLPYNKRVGDVEAEEDFIWGVVSSLHRKFGDEHRRSG
jgi:SOS-response transcriptional repressor LexA